MLLSAHELEALLHEVQRFKGQRVRFIQKISRNRALGMNRHHTTTSSFLMQVEMVSCAFSGFQLMFVGGGSSYGVAMGSVAMYEFGGDFVEVVEHFEQQMERRTRITIEDED